jgi:hypothetical protein
MLLNLPKFRKESGVYAVNDGKRCKLESFPFVSEHSILFINLRADDSKYSGFLFILIMDYFVSRLI